MKIMTLCADFGLTEDNELYIYELGMSNSQRCPSDQPLDFEIMQSMQTLHQQAGTTKVFINNIREPEQLYQYAAFQFLGEGNIATEVQLGTFEPKSGHVSDCWDVSYDPVASVDLQGPEHTVRAQLRVERLRRYMVDKLNDAGFEGEVLSSDSVCMPLVMDKVFLHYLATHHEALNIRPRSQLVCAGSVLEGDEGFFLMKPTQGSLGAGMAIGTHGDVAAKIRSMDGEKYYLIEEVVPGRRVTDKSGKTYQSTGRMFFSIVYGEADEPSRMVFHGGCFKRAIGAYTQGETLDEVLSESVFEEGVAFRFTPKQQKVIESAFRVKVLPVLSELLTMDFNGILLEMIQRDDIFANYAKQHLVEFITADLTQEQFGLLVGHGVEHDRLVELLFRSKIHPMSFAYDEFFKLPAWAGNADGLSQFHQTIYQWMYSDGQADKRRLDNEDVIDHLMTTQNVQTIYQALVRVFEQFLTASREPLSDKWHYQQLEPLICFVRKMRPLLMRDESTIDAFTRFNDLLSDQELKMNICLMNYLTDWFEKDNISSRKGKREKAVQPYNRRKLRRAAGRILEHFVEKEARGHALTADEQNVKSTALKYASIVSASSLAATHPLLGGSSSTNDDFLPDGLKKAGSGSGSGQSKKNKGKGPKKKKGKAFKKGR